MSEINHVKWTYMMMMTGMGVIEGRLSVMVD